MLKLILLLWKLNKYTHVYIYNINYNKINIIIDDKTDPPSNKDSDPPGNGKPFFLFI